MLTTRDITRLNLCATLFVAILMLFPVQSKAKGVNKPLTQYMLVDRAEPGYIHLRDITKVASLLKQIGFKVSLTGKGMEPTDYTLTASRTAKNGGITHLKYTCDDMSDIAECEIFFADKTEFDEFVYTLAHTGWKKQSNTYILRLDNTSDAIWVAAYLKGPTVKLVNIGSY